MPKGMPKRLLDRAPLAGSETPTKKRERPLDVATEPSEAALDGLLEVADSSETRAEFEWETARGYENEKMDIRQMEADKKTPHRSKKPFNGDGLNPDLPVHPQVWKVSIHGEEGVRACVEWRR